MNVSEVIERLENLTCWRGMDNEDCACCEDRYDLIEELKERL